MYTFNLHFDCLVFRANPQYDGLASQPIHLSWLVGCMPNMKWEKVHVNDAIKIQQKEQQSKAKSECIMMQFSQFLKRHFRLVLQLFHQCSSVWLHCCVSRRTQHFTSPRFRATEIDSGLDWNRIRNESKATTCYRRLMFSDLCFFQTTWWTLNILDQRTHPSLWQRWPKKPPHPMPCGFFPRTMFLFFFLFKFPPHTRNQLHNKCFITTNTIRREIHWLI